MKYILAFLFIFCSQQLYGQWVLTSGPSAGPSSMAFNSKGDIFDLKRYFLRSLDDGLTWENISDKLPKSTTTTFSVTPTGELFFQGYKQHNIYYSLDKGDSWTMQSTLPYRFQTTVQGTSNGYLFCANAVNDSVAFVTTFFLVRSIDNGKTWVPLDSFPYSISLELASNDSISFNDFNFMSSCDY